MGVAKKVIAVLATLDTKGAEAEFLRERIAQHGCEALLVDLGVVGPPAARADLSREEVAAAGGTPLSTLLQHPSREVASPVMIAGASKLLGERVLAGTLHAVLGMGGTQGTTTGTQIMQSLPYGFPKVMVSTVASGDTAPFVGIKDITMMFSVGDILGLNRFTRQVLANAAGAACGMAEVENQAADAQSGRPVVGMTNLGVLTEGTHRALESFEAAGVDVIVFHAVGSGGRAMEQMMREGILQGVFDYALGEISDELFKGLRAGGAERLRVAAELGLPQVICPGGAEHLGLFVDPPRSIPEAYKGHQHVFHSPVIFVPRLKAEEMARVGQEVATRLAKVKGHCVMMLPEGGTSRYSIAGNDLHDPASDESLFRTLEERLPATVEVVRRPRSAEDPEFVRECVERLVAMLRQLGTLPAA